MKINGSSVERKDPDVLTNTSCPHKHTFTLHENVYMVCLCVKSQVAVFDFKRRGVFGA